MNSVPVDYKKNAKKLLEKQKPEKALNMLNLAINDNKYKYEFFELRSKVKEMLGDIYGTKTDKLKSRELMIRS